MHIRIVRWVAFCAVFIVSVYSRMLSYTGFGPEYAYFYVLTNSLTAKGLWEHYTQVGGAWYRPTSFYLPYWIARNFIDWHNLAGWRLLDLCTVMAAACLVYQLTLLLFPERRLAGIIAAVYFATNPSLYVVVFEVSSFDFLHIFFVTLSVILYIVGLRSGGTKTILWTILAWCSFLVALTCKEVTIVTPVYLGFVSLVFLISEKGRRLRAADVAWECLRVAPFVVLICLYWWVHVRNIPPGLYSSSGDYRIESNATMMLQNMVKFPLWMARIWGGAQDSMRQAAAFNNPLNNCIGVIGLLAVLAQWGKNILRKTVPLRSLVLAVGWIAIFLIVPVFSGGYLWHANLAMIGFAVLYGVAVAQMVEWSPSAMRRKGSTAAFFLGLFLLSWLNMGQFMAAGSHRDAYLLDEKLIHAPPLPAERIGPDALVYAEDRFGYGKWFYGGNDDLFRFVYLNPKLEEKSVPPMSKVPNSLRREWLARKNAYFFRYDDHFNWRDGTEEFRANSLASLASNISQPQPKVTQLFPATTVAGQAFNRQPDGSAALGVGGDNFTRDSVIMFGSTPLGTAYGGEHSVSATIPAELFKKPGKYPVYIVDDGRESGRVDFVVK